MKDMTVNGLGVICLSIAMSGCASLLDMPAQAEPAQYEREATPMEKYVDCVRDKKRKESDPPCLLES
jgi:hypothetical protein